MNHKRLLSAFLAASMLAGVIPAGAVNEQPETEIDTAQADAELEAYLSQLGSMTIRDANPQSTEDQSTEDQPSAVAEYSADEQPSADTERTSGVVLFSTEKGVLLEKLHAKLAAQGVNNVQPVLPDADFETEEVWYEAQCAAGQEITVSERLKMLDGIASAEPEYIYHTDSIGVPEEIETQDNWVINDLHRKTGECWWMTELSEDKNPGEGAVVAVIDTGVDYTHPDLKANMWVNVAELEGQPGVDDDGDGYIDDIYGVNVTASGTKAGDPMDDHGHGTHVAGIIGMSGNGEGGIGLAWGTKIMAIKAGQSTGTFTSRDIAKAINYAHMKGADVINMSFGGTEKSLLVEQALASAFQDCVLVASAGNDGLPTTDAPDDFVKKEDIYPAGYSYVLGVMATGQDGSLASFSNWDYTNNANAEYELTAPGVDVYSTLPGGRYAKWSGTSMAAPCVSAAAAIIRSRFEDKNTYNSRFIMGQLASATEQRTTYTDKLGDRHTYAALDIYHSCTKLPKPNLAVKQVFALDSERTDNEVNDGDGVIDAGETIDLGVCIRNQWGMTGKITVKADAVSEAGVKNPYIEFVNDTVTLDAAGTFAERDNGFVWDDSYLESVSNPITFKVSKDTPNDAEIRINLTVTTTNSFDEKDTETYTCEGEYTFRVLKGRAISGELESDFTLTNDYYWIIENTLYVPEGKTLTVEPGTQVQFWGSDPTGPYGSKTMAGIINSGTLNMIGTEEQPIECFPSSEFSNYVVEIAGDGVETLKYCDIINPRLGYTGQATPQKVDIVEHCRLVQNQEANYIRYFQNGKITESQFYSSSYGFCVESVNRSVISGFRYGNNTRNLKIGNEESNCYNRCNVVGQTNSTWSKLNNSVIMPATNNKVTTSTRLQVSAAVPKNEITIPDNPILTFGDKKYVFFNDKITSGSDTETIATKYALMRDVAKSMNGTLLCLNSDEEKDAITKKMYDLSESTRIDGDTNTLYIFAWLGYMFDSQTEKYVWDDNNAYTGKVLYSFGQKYTWFRVGTKTTGIHDQMIDATSRDTSDIYTVLELPSDLSDETILQNIQNFDYDSWLFDYYKPTFTNCAILNPVLNTDTSKWATFTAPDYNKNIKCYNLSGNYWGTENKKLINEMITDADDFAGTLGNIVADPILTTNDDLSDIYPFVTSVALYDADGNIVTTASPGSTYTVRVKFNRDMEQSVQPTVTYGPAEPYTDYSVSGSWASAREWVGTTTISPVLTSGVQYFRTIGGCAADDNWLVCGEDILRFGFHVNTTGALAMMLNAEGGANEVTLSWAQNDYATLAGYNLYRSEKENTGFTKINTSVLTDTTYVDTNVKPGVTYYYYFKVVNTAGVEEKNQSNTASAAPIDNIKPTLTHTPVKSARAGVGVTISAKATDNISVAAVKLYYRAAGVDEYQCMNMVAGENNLYAATIPAAAVKGSELQYYVTAEDGDGNMASSGTVLLPNKIAINSKAYVTGLTPTSVKIDGGTAVTILGGGFTEGMTLTVGGKRIDSYTLVDDGQIRFTAPAMPVGAYPVKLTAADGSEIASVSLNYTDAALFAQIPTDMEMVSGESYRMPLYVTAKGNMTSFHAEIDIPYGTFTSVKAVKADADASFAFEQNYTGGTLYIGASAADNLNPGNEPIAYIELIPTAVSEDKTVELKLHNVQVNGANIDNVTSGRAAIKPNFSLTADAKYYANDAAVEGVTITAGGVSAVTNSTGKAQLSGITTPNVTVTASKSGRAENAVNAMDASLTLQYSVKLKDLTELQRAAADVDGNGVINEQDAALILQMAVRNYDNISQPLWKFVPASINKVLGNSQNTTSFHVILLGDVDGSWK